MARKDLLRDRRFATRFLGRPHTWVWLAATGVLCLAAWYMMALPTRAEPGGQRSWFLWSGNVLLALFVLTLTFSARKWSIKLPRFRDWGRQSSDRADACWAEIQNLNRAIQKGAYGDDAEILAAADDLLKRFGIARVERAVVDEKQLSGGRTLRYVRTERREPFGRLEAWCEMHMGVGTVACLGVLFHADFVIRHPIGWMLVVLSMIVLVTGVIGAVLYRTVPAKLARADAGIPFEEAGVAQRDYHGCVEGLFAILEPEVQQVVHAGIMRAASADELRARSSEILGQVNTKHPGAAEKVRELLVMAGSRDYLRWTFAQARRLDFQLKLWRWIHVPISVFLMLVVVVHVLAVLYY